MTLVKICGITNPDDARLAASLGADILGFNFYTVSPRYIAPNLVSEIICDIDNSVRTVGVFVNEPIDDLLGTAEKTGIGAVQLHGDETPEYVDEMRVRCDLKILKAFRISNDFDFNAIGEYDIDAILLDAYAPDVYGGSGEMADWNLARRVTEDHAKVYLAGGLNPENVKAAIESVRPFAVDVASGVEFAKGRKDAKKLEHFIRNAKSV